MNEHLKVDPYNFKFPSRKDLMSLNKIDRISILNTKFSFI